MNTLKTKSLSFKLSVLFLAAAMLVNLTGLTAYTSAAEAPNLLHKAYITSFNTGVVDVVNLENNTVEKGKIQVGSQPNSAGFNPTGTQIYVTNRGSSSVSVIDPATDTVISTIPVGASPHGVAFNASGSKAYVANLGNGSISVIDTAALAVTNTIAVSGSPSVNVVVGNKLFAASQTDHSVKVVDLAQEKLVTSISIPAASTYGLSVNPAGTKLYAANKSGNSVSVINVSDNTVEGTIAVGSSPHATEFSPDGSRVYVANASSNNVSVIDTATNTVIKTIPVGSNPYVIGASADGKHAYTINYSSSNMSVIDTDTLAVTDTITLSNGPFMVGTFMVSTAAAATPVTPQVAAPEANPAAGALPSGTEVALTSATEGASIYYTTDGSAPTSSSQLYSSPIAVTQALTLKAIAVKADMKDSEVMIQDYTLTAPENSTIEPDTAVFDKRMGAQADIAVSMTLKGNTLTSIEYAGKPLTAGTDYTVSGNNVILSAAYLAKQPVGSMPFTFIFSAGASQALTVSIADTTQIPGAPVLQPAVAGNGQVQLTWTPVEGSASYTIYQSVSSATYGEALATVSSSVYTYTAAGLTNGTAYYYAVQAVNSAGDSPVSNQASATPITVPGAPLAASAAAGDTTAVIQFTQPADNGGSAVTGYEISSDTGGIKVSSASSPVIITGLQNGTAYTFTVKAINAAGTGIAAATNTVTPAVAVVTTPGPAASPPPVATGTAVLVNGQLQTIGQSAVTQSDNQTVTTLTLDEAKLQEQLNAAGNGAVITLPFTAASDVFVGELNGQMVGSLEQKQAVIKIQTPQASYTLPASLLRITSLSQQLEQTSELQQITLQIRIAAPDAAQLQAINNIAASGNFTLAAAPLEFTVTASSGGKTINVNTFNTYVERSIKLPSDADASRITTALVIEPDGSLRHVPTKVLTENGGQVALINSLTNSTYAVVYHPVSFADVAGHWSQSVVNDLASRMVLNGTEDGAFHPGQDMTRAEFTASLVRALGLKLENGTAAFTDVQSSAWYSQAVQTAVSHNLIQGFEDQTFRPLDKITREQAMTIIAKALAYSPVQTAGSQAAPLSSFSDAGQVSGWAAAGVSEALTSGIVSGRTESTLAPKANVTRAEVAALIHRFLVKSGLI
ncbi:S-layer homology domain-containing protein [Paenibacillus camerounensis]|uniref:S-layer homology domain-containing protein n=1 Tax=Paenibacillus camerounensis TaxID=1243663 RepID=UPI0006941A8D|nr:S-layer homology domain-containing protein [Paenibacillus camerounensis]